MTKNSYKIPISLSILGLLAISYPALSDVTWEVRKHSLQEEEDFNRFQLKQRAETSQTISESGLNPNWGYTLTISDYLDNPNSPPKIRQEFLGSYFQSDEIWVYDSSQKCIGKIKNRKFIWNREQEVCSKKRKSH